jgi:hypothetical protein
MYLKKTFSIIELLTVILVILLLISLIIPVFVNLKQNARASICKSQLRQMGVLITSYVSDYGGYLPNDGIYSYNDFPWNGGARHIGDISQKVGNSSLYKHWNGHLLPYLSENILPNYDRDVNGIVVTSKGEPFLEIQPVPSKIESVLKGGWAVLDDALYKGGYQDLRIFICPEIHNTIDVGGSVTYNGLKVPRINLLLYQYGKTGTPTTYLANSSFFGHNQDWRPDANSKRLDQLNDISNKVLLVEGGHAFTSDNIPYFLGGNVDNIIGRCFAISAYGIDIVKSKTSSHRFSFVHDNILEFWSTYGDKVNDASLGYYYNGINCTSTTASEFNKAFAGKAYMLPMSAVGVHTGYHIVSLNIPIDDNGALNSLGLKYYSFLMTKGINTPYKKYEYYDSDFHYLSGNMNILFGDNSVSTKDQGWLYNNRLLIASDENKE